MTKIFNNKSTIAKVICLMVVAAVMASVATMVFADGTNLVNAVKKICTDIGTVMTAIICPVSAVIIGFCIIRLIFGGNSKSADSSIQWIKRTVIAFVCFNLLGLFLNYGVDLLANLGGTQWGAPSNS